MQFGHRSISIEDNRTESRYVRGAPYMTYFARGSRDGVVKVWDFRSITVSTATAPLTHKTKH